MYTIEAIASSDGFDPVLHLYRRACNQLVTIAADRLLPHLLSSRLDKLEERVEKTRAGHPRRR